MICKDTYLNIWTSSDFHTWQWSQSVRKSLARMLAVFQDNSASRVQTSLGQKLLFTVKKRTVQIRHRNLQQQAWHMCTLMALWDGIASGSWCIIQLPMSWHTNFHSATLCTAVNIWLHACGCQDLKGYWLTRVVNQQWAVQVKLCTIVRSEMEV